MESDAAESSQGMHGKSGIEEDDQSGDDGEFLDVLDILDGRGEPDDGNGTAERPAPVPGERTSDDIAQDDGDQDESQEEDTSNPFLPSDGEEDIPEALDDLNSFITNLEATSKKRKSPEPEANGRPRKRRFISEKTEAGPENEFGVRLGGTVPFHGSISA